MLRLAPDNSLLNGDNQPVVLKGAGLGGTFSVAAQITIHRLDEYGKLYHWVSVA